MAFTTATGYGNLPNGNFSPVIYSKKVQLAFRKSTVCGDITNSDYFGEIASQGDTVKIIKEPEISVSEYARGTNVTAQDLQDEDFSLVVDKANYFAFKMDDIEEAHSHVNFMDLATNRAAYRLADQHDQEVLGYMSGYKQSSLHSQADALNTTVNGTKAVSTAGSNELLSLCNCIRMTLATSLQALQEHTLFLWLHVCPVLLHFQLLRLHQQWLLLVWLVCLINSKLINKAVGL